jgi:hypothetical protein
VTEEFDNNNPYSLDGKGSKKYFSSRENIFNFQEGKRVERGFVFKGWVYFLCVSFLLLAGGFHTMIVEANGMSRPLGEMVSRGEVKFDSGKAVWRNVELSQFPIFAGMRIKTGKGASLITLEGNRQIEVGENSLLLFDRSDQMHLTQGTIHFRLLATAELSFKVGDLIVIQSKSPQASKNPSAVSPKSEATIGSISVHSNGAVSVRTLQGSLSVLNQKGVPLASLSSGSTITLPSVAVNGPSKVTVAQGDKKTDDPEPESGKFLGVPTWVWIATGMALGVATVAVIGITTTGGGGSGGATVVVCP